MATNWTCPFCNRPQVVTKNQNDYFTRRWNLQSHSLGEGVGVEGWAFACSNSECGEINFGINLIHGVEENRRGDWDFYKTDDIERFVLRPSHFAKPQPDFIPKPLRDDYLEACKIRDLSPKASATLARRALQGMIRDFCGISKARLIDEIKSLKQLVDTDKAPKGVSHESVEAIDHVRSIGNIGAHMEMDINLIIEVDSDEAQILIELIESLFDEWYVERQKRIKRFAKLEGVAAKKKALKEGAKSSTDSKH